VQHSQLRPQRRPSVIYTPLSDEAIRPRDLYTDCKQREAQVVHLRQAIAMRDWPEE
jgi:hypothetical protein